ncbi:Allophanate hydrolase subunit 2 [Polaribacter irgensii 23-P]|uniref:Allophanate hydrolase subunit 2 n=1 Tax=Polaribacter irgensii 23-P TaxID=313594 RepID=A4BZY8_9FLAO|nr:biotin-dependent carboxyltransferase family protein [Polaribacter irgensii]EAR12731.1 Allophanate hydrolase subunit 2 [Polaribacter irgensii 23-P]
MLSVLKPGFFNSIQDKGRFGFAAIGVPVAGVMDESASELANSVLNNTLEAAVLEIYSGSCEFQFLCASFICISGGDFSAKINNQAIGLNKKISVFPNDIVSFGKAKYGARCYLAVAGGIQSEVKLNSRSFYKGITQDVFLKRGMKIAILEVLKSELVSNASIKVNALHFSSSNIKCYKGPEFERLQADQQKKLIENFFSISKDINRMGYRLNETIPNTLSSILTSAVLPGTVQLTPSGKLIILMRDCQVTGGYPRVLQLSEEAINCIAQKSTNSQFRFVLEKL